MGCFPSMYSVSVCERKIRTFLTCLPKHGFRFVPDLVGPLSLHSQAASWRRRPARSGWQWLSQQVARSGSSGALELILSGCLLPSEAPWVGGASVSACPSTDTVAPPLLGGFTLPTSIYHALIILQAQG